MGTLAALLASVAGCGGAGTKGPSGGAEQHVQSLDRQVKLTPEEVGDLARSYAERFVGLMASATDEIKHEERGASAAVRRRAQAFKVLNATAAYEIAAQPQPYSRVMDLVVLATLESQVWIDDGLAEATFGPSGARALVTALRRARVEADEMASHVMTADELEMLDYLIWNWRRANPEVERVEFVRFADFVTARGSGGGAAAAAAAAQAGGMFASIRQASVSVDETRQFLDRVAYQLQRQPTLIRWQVETAKEDLLATPEVARALDDADRLTRAIERAPADAAAERRAILAAFDDRQAPLNATVANVRGALSDADRVIVALGETSRSMNEMLRSADAAMARIDDWSRRESATAATQPSRPFDVREYTQALRELSTAVERMNQLVGSSNELIGSQVWDKRIEQVNEAADGRVRAAAAQSQQLVDEVFRRVYLTLGLLLVVLVLYRLTASLLWRGTHRNGEYGPVAEEGRGGRGGRHPPTPPSGAGTKVRPA